MPTPPVAARAAELDIVDSQCHVSTVWYEPVEALLEQMHRNEIAQAVLVQMLGQTDNTYQQTCLRRFPQRFASVVLIDSEAPNALATLHQLADEGAAGLRLRPTARTPGADPLALWRAAAERGMVVSCVGSSAAFASVEFEQLIEALPLLTVVLEHLGGTSQADTDEGARMARASVMRLGRLPNVYLKVPGLGELQARRSPPPVEGSPFEAGIPEALAQALTRFGPHRLMWGSDYPPVSSREGYHNALHLCRNALQPLPPADLAEIFSGVARRVFKLSKPLKAAQEAFR